MYANTYCVDNVHNSNVVGREGGGLFTGFAVLFSSFSAIYILKNVIIGLKLIMSSVTMLKHNIIYKRCLGKYNKS